ncbi:MAG: phage portal protein [Magnetococcales bacterium]|nr:phage portal protein [Magnetococcales bacterium]
MASWIDGLVSLFAPETAIRRARARYALRALRRGYDGAKTGRLTSGWTTAGTDANAEIAMAYVRLRDRARDLVRNNPYAAKAVMTHASSMIGAGIRPRPKAATQELDDQVTDLWDAFTENCDADGRTTFYGIQTLMARSMVESGECLLQMVNRPSSFGLRVPLQLRVLECDHLDSTCDRELPGGGFVQQGIEFDAFGTRVAYQIFPRHPGSTRPGMNLKSIRVPASDVLHLYDRLRPGQNRGVTWFAPALLRMRDMDDYDVSELVRKKMEACFVGFVTNAEPPPDTGGDDEEQGKKIEDLVPGMLEYLPPGRDVRFAQPAPTSGYAEYAQLHNHAVAAGLGLTYELLTGDLSRVNYSSIRAGLIEFRRRVDATQRHVLIPQLCQPIWNRFLATVQAAGLFGNIPIRLQWTPPRFEAVDPQKDIMAEILSVRAGLMSPQTAISRQGYDPDVVMAEFNEMYQIWDLYKIIVDIDARKTTRNGQLKPMETANVTTAE